MRDYNEEMETAENRGANRKKAYKSILSDLVVSELNYDRYATGKKMHDLRYTSEEARKFVCFYSIVSRMAKGREETPKCQCYNENKFACSECTAYKKNYVSEKYEELDPADPGIFGELIGQKRKVYSQEGVHKDGYVAKKGKKPGEVNFDANLDLGILLKYSFLTKTPITEIIVMVSGYKFDANGIVVEDGLDLCADNSVEI